MPAAIAGALFAAACTEEQPLCEERTKRCLSIKTRDVRLGAQDRFEIQLTNVCHDEIEYKLCFEVHGEEADCRQGYLAATRRVDESISLARFGGRTRIFVRYESEAKACRFPLTRDVEF
ncbi:MAG: hypothetical protein ACLFV8_08865 [Alphaproteobacteria bacterium]